MIEKHVEIVFSVPIGNMVDVHTSSFEVHGKLMHVNELLIAVENEDSITYIPIHSIELFCVQKTPSKRLSKQKRS